MKKKFLTLSSMALLLAAILCCLFVLPEEAMAATEGYYSYNVSNGEVTITQCSPLIRGNITIPSILGGYPVTTIGDHAFSSCKDLTGITILDGVESIGYEAFSWCSNLTSVSIPNSVAYIGDYAFYSCTGLTSVTIGNGVTKVARGAFQNCPELNDVNITNLAAWCKINFSDDNANPLYHADNLYLNGELVRDLVIPDSVTSIGDYAFYNCDGLTSVTISDNVTSIGNYAFRFCDGLTNVTIGSSVTSIGDWAFQTCKNLTVVDFNATNCIFMSSDDYPVFSGCTNLTTINLGNNVTTIPPYAFLNCDALSVIIIPDSVQSIGTQAFYSCNDLTSVTIGSGVESIDSYAFSFCKSLSSIVIPDSVTSVGYFAFGECTIKRLIVAEGSSSVTSTMVVCKETLSEVIIPNSVTYIGDYAFKNCNGLISVTIGNSVTTIGTGAFSNCTKLASIVIPNNVSILNRSTFYGCKELKSVTFGTGLLTIDSWAFYSCESLTSIELTGGIKKVGMYAFENCRNLNSVTIGKDLSEIGDYAFRNCEKLTDLNFYALRCSFGTSTFEGGENKPVFVNCFALSKIVIGDKVKTIPRYFLYDCDAVKSIELPEGVVVIYDFAFSDCNGLTTVTIPKSVTTIGADSFYNCTNIRTVYYGGTTAESKTLYYYSGNDALKNATWLCTDPHHHNYARKTTRATCTTKGYTTYTCECGYTYKDNETKALGHSYKSGSCTRCKYKPTGAKITTQPVNVAVASGKTAKVTVKASGDGLKYTWYYAKKGAKTYTKATSATNSYSLKMSSSYNGTKVYCVVTDQYGNSVKSNVVTLYKGTAAKITTQPKSTTVANGKTGKLTIKASGSSLKYSWYIKYKGASSFTKVGKSSKSYSFKMASKLDGAQVYCVVKDKYGIEVKSSVVTLKMPVQPKITTQPKSVKAFSGKTVKFTVKASGEGLKYQWYYAKKGSSKFKKLSAKSATYSVKVSSSVDGRRYYCVVTDKYGQTVKTSAVTLTMQKAAKITTQPKNVSVKNGKTAKVTIKAVGDGLSYRWYYLKPGDTKYTKATATGASYSVKMAAAWKNAKVYCVIADKYGNTVKSKVVTLKMK